MFLIFIFISWGLDIFTEYVYFLNVVFKRFVTVWNFNFGFMRIKCILSTKKCSKICLKIHSTIIFFFNNRLEFLLEIIVQDRKSFGIVIRQRR